MRSVSTSIATAVVLACALAAAAGVLRASSADSANAVEAELTTVRQVAGIGVHFMTTVIVHSSEPTETGRMQRSTETIDLTGDLTGRILYQPTSVIDFANATLINTGHQVFSGTVLGSAPVMLYDDEFRFEVNLATGAAAGKVYLTDNIAGPKIRCELDIVATGRTEEGNISASYTGHCTFKTH
jgi:hypothetical protein